MSNLSRRIEALEKKTSALRLTHRQITEHALGTLSKEHLMLLISAFGADREHRQLTDEETTARQAYRLALERQGPRWGSQSPVCYATIPDINTIQQAIIIALAHRFSSEEFRVVRAGLEARLRDDQPNEQESTALQSWDAYTQQIYLSAGFRSSEEFTNALEAAQ